jgi:hypothetical protein
VVALWGTKGLVVKATYEAGHFTEVSKGYHAVTCTISRDMDNHQLDSSGLADSSIFGRYWNDSASITQLLEFSVPFGSRNRDQNFHWVNLFK